MVEIGMFEMNMVIVVHAAFAVPLNDGALNGALASIFILVSKNRFAQFSAELGKGASWRYERGGNGFPNGGEFALYGRVRRASRTGVQCVGQVHSMLMGSKVSS